MCVILNRVLLAKGFFARSCWDVCDSAASKRSQRREGLRGMQGGPCTYLTAMQFARCLRTPPLCVRISLSLSLSPSLSLAPGFTTLNESRSEQSYHHIPFRCTARKVATNNQTPLLPTGPPGRLHLTSADTVDGGDRDSDSDGDIDL
jgi:hypothetical protein